jgi:hypothetical protein
MDAQARIPHHPNSSIYYLKMGHKQSRLRSAVSLHILTNFPSGLQSSLLLPVGWQGAISDIEMVFSFSWQQSYRKNKRLSESK